jgi:hypothetical protein
MPELTITPPYVYSRVDSSAFNMGNPMPESTLFPSQGLWIWPQLGNSLVAGGGGGGNSIHPLWGFGGGLALHVTRSYPFL